ncbi:MAG: 4-hydroxy-tetrahydrodipicolinate synthase [Bacteroidales bacterium]|nr:4-hydroxy-tetrahydrodipicolinate synthase [Bacteroidales bacterium]
MSNVILRGCGTALITPFRDGAVDYDAFAALVDRQIEGGIDFLVPLGTTGETPCLSDAEKIRVLEIAKEHSCGRPVVAGVGTNSLDGTVANMKLLSGHGADAFLVVVPYYNKPPQEGMYQYFKAVAEASDKPVILYNVPGRTGSNMTAETTLRLAALDNIIAIKEASSKREQILEILQRRPEGFGVLSGNDDETLDLMENGADGIISVASNIAPEPVTALAHAVLEGRMDEARMLQDKLSPLFRNCFVESNPIPAKAALAAMGLISNELRLPLVPASEWAYGIMEDTLKELGLLK